MTVAPIRGPIRTVATIIPLDSDLKARIYPDPSPKYEDQWSTWEEEREGDGVWGIVISNDDDQMVKPIEKWGIFGYEAAMGEAYRLLEEE